MKENRSQLLQLTKELLCKIEGEKASFWNGIDLAKEAIGTYELKESKTTPEEDRQYGINCCILPQMERHYEFLCAVRNKLSDVYACMVDYYNPTRKLNQPPTQMR